MYWQSRHRSTVLLNCSISDRQRVWRQRQRQTDSEADRQTDGQTYLLIAAWRAWRHIDSRVGRGSVNLTWYTDLSPPAVGHLATNLRHPRTTELTTAAYNNQYSVSYTIHVNTKKRIWPSIPVYSPNFIERSSGKISHLRKNLGKYAHSQNIVGKILGNVLWKILLTK